MTETWMSYGEAAAKLNSSVGAVRKRALRGHWARRAGNDGKSRILVPDETSMGRPTPVRVDVVSTVSALQAHIETLKTELAASEARVDKLSADLAGERAEHQEQLAAAMAQLVDLARRLAAIAEAKAEPEPARRSVGRRAWEWLKRN
jgi:hypothetical protein